MSIVELFCDVDDFWQQIEAQWDQQKRWKGEMQRHREQEMAPSEIITLLIHFHQSGYRTFKHYYCRYVQIHLRQEFPHQLSYTRFVESMGKYLTPMTQYLHTKMGACTGMSFIDSTPLAVCKNPRIAQHKVFSGLAERGKTSVGWFFGFKLHLVINDLGELLAFRLTPGNCDDREPVSELTQRLFGKMIGDKGYISASLLEQLLSKGVHLVTRIRKNMKNCLVPILDKILIKKRPVIESVNNILKQVCQIEHSRHRSPINFLVNLISGLIAYCWLPDKPSMNREVFVDLLA